MIDPHRIHYIMNIMSSLVINVIVQITFNIIVAATQDHLLENENKYDATTPAMDTTMAMKEDLETTSTMGCSSNGKFYKHGQKIEQTNRCDYCLCGDGEVFCFWQCDDLTQITVWNDNDRTPMLSVPSSAITSTIVPDISRETSTIEISRFDSITDKRKSSNDDSDYQNCMVTGTEYKPGEIVPSEPGSCLQCKCASNGQVSCLPQEEDCVSLQQDVYRHGIDSNSLDMFDVDIF